MNKWFKKKHAYYIFTAVIFMIVLDYIIKNSHIIGEKNNLSLGVFVYLLVFSEALFILGIFLMLKGIGLFNIRWRDILKFKLSSLRFTGQLTYVGFVINRVAAVIPWLYVLIFGRDLPLHVILAITAELAIVLWLGISIKVANEMTIASRLLKLFR